jgi:hypothetical protein
MKKPNHPEAREFHVETRFQTLARRPGGVPRDEAIKQADQQIERVKPQFDEWAEGAMQEFAALIEKAKSGTVDSNWISEANMRGRQLRDSATTLGFELLAFIARSLCEILDSIEAGSPCNIDSIVCHLDALVLARQPAYRRLKPDQVPELTRGLHRVVKRVTA